MTRPYEKHHLTDEQRKLAEENLPLVWWFIQKRLTARRLIAVNEIDDVASYLMFYLCRTAENYQPEKGKFSTYAMRAFWRAFNLYRANRDKYQSHTRLTNFVVDEITDTVPDKVYLYEPFVCWPDISKLFDYIRLSDNEAMMIDMYYRERLGFTEIGRRVGKTKSNVCTALRNVRQKLADYVQRAGIPVEHFTERQIA